MKKKLLKLSLFSLITMNLLFLTTSCDYNDKSTIDQNETQQEDTSSVIISAYITLPKYEKNPSAEDINNTKSYPQLVNITCPPARNQGGEGSCVSWGVGYAGKSISWHALFDGSLDYSMNILSQEYIYNQIKVIDCTSGSNGTDELNFVVDQEV
ncbi:hypothetical protein [Labilibaculum antarcticum]|uniref:Peptidase C1A papain C-terminal domain-containing protein n=1 Tax=Labilibaculum antarcticum TaxID=1717717 RepID=A0A1Y1CKQ8_9BACT|nr:hypothetical protein [Labilibaculum antarcticum]BAX80967.1 hypothetical protein ALGA_2654 [Labilibaculum antarcticum]